MYQLVKNRTTGEINCVNHIVNEIIYTIPFDPANVDFQDFKKEVLAGAELQDADGNVMTQANAFVGGLA
jgi:hypothetical protein